jgi:hypothetical protein
MDVELPVDFCVRALRHDGLLVSPFDQHSHGDGSLREKGLDAASWRAWFAAVLDHHSRLKELTSTGDFSQIDRQQVTEIFDAFSMPAGLCPGSAELRARIDALWTEYEPIGDRWSLGLTMDDDAFLRRQTPAQGRWLWQALVPFHERLPTLKVYLVDYPVPVVMTVPPLTCVIAPNTSAPDGAGYGRQVVAAAEGLTAA